MPLWRNHKFLFLSAVLFLELTLYYYPRLPNPMPVHFNFQGEPDRFVSPTRGITEFAIIYLALALLLTGLPLIDPFWKRIRLRREVFFHMRDVVLLIYVALYWIALDAGLRGSFQWKTPLFLLLGLLFAALGYLMPRLPRNFFFGIRTPWTLASERVWRKTHQHLGPLWMLGGLLIMILSFLPQPPWGSFFLVLGLLVLLSLVYPYVLFQREESVDL